MRPQLSCHSVHFVGPIPANTGIARQATRRSTSMVVTGSALERGCVGKLLGTRADHVRNGVANSNPEPSQVEEGYHPSGLLGVIRKDPEGMSLCRRRSPGHEPDLLRQGLRDVTTPIPGDDLDRQLQPGA